MGIQELNIVIYSFLLISCLYSVMGLFPIAMNILQFWLIDSIVKAASPDGDPLTSTSPRHSADREPLFDSNRYDDEGDEDAPVLRPDIENALFAGSSSDSLRSKIPAEEEQKYLSSRASTNDPGEAEDACPRCPPSSPHINEPRENFSTRAVSPARHRRRSSPRVASPASTLRCKALEFPGTGTPASPKTPVTSWKATHPGAIAHIELRVLHEKLGGRDGVGIAH